VVYRWAVVSTVMNGWVFKGGKFLDELKKHQLIEKTPLHAVIQLLTAAPSSLSTHN
jgi:hypothetical protein